MKEYVVLLEFRVAICDVNKANKENKSSAIREEAKEIFERRLAGIKAAEQKKKGISK